jgi:hypothetical protein
MTLRTEPMMPDEWFLEVTATRLWVGPEKAAGGKVGTLVCDLEYGSDYTDEHNAQAMLYGKLIAAAPELFAALKAAREALNSVYESDGLLPHELAAVSKIDAALAKAAS